MSACAPRKEPRVRKDGRCAACRKPRRLAKSQPPGVDPSIYRRDPFCSSDCCRAWYGTREKSPSISTGEM